MEIVKNEPPSASPDFFPSFFPDLDNLAIEDYHISVKVKYLVLEGLDMIQIRQGVFETNSSSTHSITMCLKSEWEDFVNGKTMVGVTGKVITKEQYAKLSDDEKEDEGYEDYETWKNDEYLETYNKEYKTPNGEVVVAFGKYGDLY